MIILLCILLAVALCAAALYIVRLRRDLADSELLSRTLLTNNMELTLAGATALGAAQRNKQIATLLSVENEMLRVENASHVVSLDMVLAELER